jgi:predicted acetyltransferase
MLPPPRIEDTSTPGLSFENGRIHLEKPSIAYAESYLAARREGCADTSATNPISTVSIDITNLQAHLASLNGPRIDYLAADGSRLPYAHLWMVSDQDFFGRVSIRYALNDRLRRSGGHIGYEIRPLYRDQGLGHLALALGIEHLQTHGVTEFLLTCRGDDIASSKIIERAGGVLEDVTLHPDIPGARLRRYWVKCSEYRTTDYHRQSRSR